MSPEIVSFNVLAGHLREDDEELIRYEELDSNEKRAWKEVIDAAFGADEKRINLIKTLEQIRDFQPNSEECDPNGPEYLPHIVISIKVKDLARRALEEYNNTLLKAFATKLGGFNDSLLRGCDESVYNDDQKVVDFIFKTRDRDTLRAPKTQLLKLKAEVYDLLEKVTDLQAECDFNKKD